MFKLPELKTSSIILLLYSFLGSYAFGFAMLFFKDLGYSLHYLVFFYAFYTGLSVLLIPFVKRFNFRRSLVISFLILSLMSLSLFFHIQYYSFFIYSTLLGIILISYWLPINTLFFEGGSNQKNATNSSIFLFMTGVLGTFLPLLGALVIRKFGYSWLWSSAALLALLPIFYVLKKVPKRTESAGFWESLQNFKRLRTITFLEGAFQLFTMGVIPVYTLLFLKTETEYGGFLGLLGFIGMVVAFFVSHQSDQARKRINYIFTLFYILGFLILAMVLMKTASFWIILMSIFAVFSNISWPLRLAITMDVKKIDLGFWKMREFFLNIGRTTSLLVAVFFFYQKLYWPVFLMYALIAFVYPFLVRYKLKELG